MNHEHRPSKWLVAGLVIIGLLILGSALQSSAWTQGYTMGLLTSSADSAELAPYLLYRTGPGMQGSGGFFGGILRIGVLLLVALGIFRLLGLAHWRMHGGQPPWMHGRGWSCGGENGPAEGTPPAEGESPQSPAPAGTQ